MLKLSPKTRRAAYLASPHFNVTLNFPCRDCPHVRPDNYTEWVAYYMSLISLMHVNLSPMVLVLAVSDREQDEIRTTCRGVGKEKDNTS